MDPSQALDAEVDVVVEAGRITRIGPAAAQGIGADARTVPGAGLLLLPGLVEVHAHLREPGFEHKEDIETGLRAAAAGGYAHVCAMPNTRPVNDSPEVTALMIERARQVGGPRLHPVAAVTLGLAGERVSDMAALRAAGAVAFSDDGRCVMSGAVMRAALQRARELGTVVIQHAEDHSMTGGSVMHEGEVSRRLGVQGWPREAEDCIIARDLSLVACTGARYHVAHVSTAGAVRLIREARDRGLPVTAEAAPHHLLWTHEQVARDGAACKVNPPLREPQDVQAVVGALADGTIDCVATDHAPHAEQEKGLGLDKAPPGMIGIELCLSLMMSLVNSGALRLERLVDALTARPARVIGIDAPCLRAGAPADLCVFDPGRRWVLEAGALHSKSKNTPLLGRTMQGRVQLSMVGGRIVHEA